MGNLKESRSKTSVALAAGFTALMPSNKELERKGAKQAFKWSQNSSKGGAILELQPREIEHYVGASLCFQMCVSQNIIFFLLWEAFAVKQG